MSLRLAGFELFMATALLVVAGIAQAQNANSPENSRGLASTPDAGTLSHQGAQPEFRITEVNRLSCENDGLGFFMSYSNMVAGVTQQRTVVVVDGLTYMDQLGDFLDGSDESGEAGGGVFSDATGGPINGSFPLPSGQAVSTTINILQDGELVWTSETVLDGCDTGNIVSNIAGPIGLHDPAAPVPTLPLWGLLLLAGGAGFLGIGRFRKGA